MYKIFLKVLLLIAIATIQSEGSELKLLDVQGLLHLYPNERQ
jgi:hypothetical protein